SLSLQQTLYAMGEAVLAACPEVAEVRLSLPNKHHFLVDLGPFGLDNPGEVFYPADRPYGLIEGTVCRAGARDGVLELWWEARSRWPTCWSPVPSWSPPASPAAGNWPAAGWP